jgi:lysophospholipase L1-like esterase
VTRVLLRVLLLLLVTALALVGAEFALRFVFRNANTSRNAHDFLAQKNAPVLRVNNVGFRDRDVPEKDGKYRIAVVGDSFTWGQGVDEAQRFSNLIEQALGSGYEVFNFGKPGNNMPEHLDVLTQALAIKPDFILLQLYINDWETAVMERPAQPPLLPSPLEGLLENHSILYDLLRDETITLLENTGVIDSYPRYMERNLKDLNAPNAKLAYGQLAEFFDRAHAAHVGVGAVLFPAPDALGEYGKSYPFRFLHEGTAQLCAEQHVPFLDLLPLYSTVKQPRTLWVSPFDAHPNALSNAMAAKAILATFRPVWKA